MTNTAADFMAVDNDLSSRTSPLENLRQAAVETGVIFGLFALVIAGRAITDPKILGVLTKTDVWTWVVLFFLINALLKSFYPKFDDQLLNAAIFSVVYTMMVPLKVDA